MGHYIVKINSLCNLNCCFCADSLEVRSLPDSHYQKLIEGLERNRDVFESLIISGGEPTIYPKIIPFIEHAKNVCGYKRICVVTNAVMLADKRNVERLARAGVDSFQVSFSTSNERMFDAIVKKEGSFKLAIEGLKNIKVRGGIQIRINTVLHKLNYKNIPNTVEFLIGLGADIIQLAYMNPIGSSMVDGKSAIAIPYSEALPFARQAIEAADRLGFKGIFIENFPVCVAPDLVLRISDLKKPSENKAYYNNGKLKPEKCQLCPMTDVCDGVWKAYLSQFGDGELAPLSEVQVSRIRDLAKASQHDSKEDSKAVHAEVDA